MALAVHANPGRDFWSAPAGSASPSKKTLLASVAITGAAVMTVTPMVAHAPALEAAQHRAVQAVEVAQQRAVELAAFENPFVLLSESFGKAFEELNNRGSEIGATLGPSLSAILGNQQLQRDLANVLFQPWVSLPKIAGEFGKHTGTIITGQRESMEGLAQRIGMLPAALQASVTNLFAGQFTESFAYLNDWFIWGLGDWGWPLYPTFAVPGQIARDIGAPAFGAVLDALLVGDSTLTGYAHSILVPFTSAIFRFTDSLDEIRAAVVAGDLVSAASHAINLPVKVLGAFLNGYSPSITEDWNVFPGLLSAGGPIDAFLVQYPSLIAKALRGLTGQTATTNSVEAQSKVSSAAVVSADDTITLNVGTGGDSATPVETVSSSTDATTEKEAPAEDATATEEEPVAEVAPVETVDTVAEGEESTEETAPAAEETAPAAEESTDESAAAGGTEQSGTESDAKGDNTSDEKADSKADAKADKADAKADKADKADAKADKADAKADKADKADAKADKADAKADKADAKADKADKSDAKSEGKADKADAKAGKADKSDAKSSGSGSSSSGGGSSSE